LSSCSTPASGAARLRLSRPASLPFAGALVSCRNPTNANRNQRACHTTSTDPFWCARRLGALPNPCTFGSCPRTAQDCVILCLQLHCQREPAAQLSYLICPISPVKLTCNCLHQAQPKTQSEPGFTVIEDTHHRITTFFHFCGRHIHHNAFVVEAICEGQLSKAHSSDSVPATN
jgi:hypothetical protein